MTTRTLTLFVAFVLGACVLLSSAHAGTGTRYARYRLRAGATRIAHVRIPTRCINAEDSAAHVYLYRYGHGVAVYHCKHHGY